MKRETSQAERMTQDGVSPWIESSQMTWVVEFIFSPTLPAHRHQPQQSFVRRSFKHTPNREIKLNTRLGAITVLQQQSTL